MILIFEIPSVNVLLIQALTIFLKVLKCMFIFYEDSIEKYQPSQVKATKFGVTGSGRTGGLLLHIM